MKVGVSSVAAIGIAPPNQTVSVSTSD